MRCKFKLDKIERIATSTTKKNDDGTYTTTPIEMRSVVMSPVYHHNDPDHENAKFWAASPGGSFQLNVVNLAAVEDLELGAEYYFDITKA